MISLTHLDEFKKVLSNFEISAAGTRALDQGTFVPLVAISSSGRNTIIRELVKTGDYYFVVSDTTRPPRSNDGVMEQNGVEYWFRKEEDVLADLQAGKFVEAALIHNQQVSGVSIRELENAAEQEQIAISDIEVQGVEKMVMASKHVLPIFVLPPSYDAWIERWKKRGHMSEAERAKRLESARKELTIALEANYYHFVINDILQVAVEDVKKIVAGTPDPHHEKHGRRVAKEILQQLEA